MEGWEAGREGGGAEEQWGPTLTRKRAAVSVGVCEHHVPQNEIMEFMRVFVIIHFSIIISDCIFENASHHYI